MSDYLERKFETPEIDTPTPPEVEGLEGRYIGHEMWREYDFSGRVYRIDKPKWLYYRPGGTTHRVVDQNEITHLLPAPGFYGCVIRWKNPVDMDPVQF